MKYDKVALDAKEPFDYMTILVAIKNRIRIYVCVVFKDVIQRRIIISTFLRVFL